MVGKGDGSVAHDGLYAIRVDKMGVLEGLISGINENVFLREFSFSRGQFSPTPGDELEFADNVVWLGGLLLLFQAKERTGTGDHDRWFKKKVIGHATKQIRDTVRYLEQYGSVALTNNRGHEFKLSRDEVVSRHCVVVYDTPTPTRLMLATRHHMSKSVGVIHVFSLYDYRHMCRVLATPREVNEYLGFRHALLQRAVESLPSEKALVGQFLAGHLEAPPREDFAAMVDRLNERRPEWDISGITGRFGDRITYQFRSGGDEPAVATQYYEVLAEVASLSRAELAAFRDRFELALTAAKEGRLQAPLRMISESGCGFLFVAVPAAKAEGRLQGLENLTLGSKYEQRLERHVGVVISPDGEEMQIDWAYVQSPWRHNPEIEALLASSNPFRPLSNRLVPRYTFEGETEPGSTNGV